MTREQEIRIRASDSSNLLFGAEMVYFLLSEIDRLREELKELETEWNRERGI